MLLAAALQRVAQLINKGGTQAFRVAQARSMLGLDIAPTTIAIWQYSELLLAELDTATALAKKDVCQKNCRLFMSENGCRAGKNCKWPHECRQSGAVLDLRWKRTQKKRVPCERCDKANPKAGREGGNLRAGCRLGGRRWKDWKFLPRRRLLSEVAMQG